VASPPWMGLHFVAVKGAVGLSAFPIVVTGTVLPAGANTQLEAMIRPHGSVLIGTAIFVILAAFNASQSGSVGRIILPVAALLAYMLLVGLSRERARPVEALLKEVCR